MTYGERVLEFVQYVCKNYGARLAGSEGEMKTGDYIYELMSNFCDEVKKEWFVSRPKGFTDYIWITSMLYILGVAFYFMEYWIITFILISIGMAIFIFQQCLHHEIIDFLFPKVQEFHVIGKIIPKETLKRKILLSAHYDSPYEFPLVGKLRHKSALIILPLIVLVLLTAVLSILRYFYDIDFIQKPLLIIGTIWLLIVALTLRSNKLSLGANDDLAGVGVVLEAGRVLSDHRLKNTEVWIVAFAGEEHMRGSKRFVEKNFSELKDAILFNFECPSADYFLIATEEKMFFAKHSLKAVEIAKKACENVKANFKVGSLPFAGSDAANFSRKGLHATTIFGLAKD
ncbi:MAG: M28 family peptidase, partial [Archaeoglobaceae archaeon]|nr:M28 family peptidase [Archaeoglobaceae archaeon]MDW8118843.1 M28 family peptidase [Archaeoglobaceae archaeon]